MKVFGHDKFESDVSHYKYHTHENGNKFVKTDSMESSSPVGMRTHKKTTYSSKPVSTAKEPSHCDELATKLGYLVDKVVELAQGEGNITNQDLDGTLNLLRDKSPISTKSKASPRKNNCDWDNVSYEKFTEFLDEKRSFERPYKQYSTVGYVVGNQSQKMNDIYSLDRNKDLKSNPQYMTYNMGSKNSSHPVPTVPPILNDGIKYIRVSSNSTLGKDDNSEDAFRKGQVTILGKKLTSVNGSVGNQDRSFCEYDDNLFSDRVRESLKLRSSTLPTDISDIIDEVPLERFRVLVSGHLTNRATPVFIIHSNYVEPSNLLKDSLDFKTRKKRGNVDISLTGKFFNENILIENEKGPFALDLKSHTLLIDRKSTVTRENFKHIFNLGTFDAILEGEFVANSETSQFIPIFSLEVVKSRAKENLNKEITVNQMAQNSSTDNLKSRVYRSKKEERNNQDNRDHCCLLCSNDILEESSLDTLKNMKIKRESQNLRESKLTKLRDSILPFFKSKSNDSNNVRKSSKNKNTVKKCDKKETILKGDEVHKQGEDDKSKETASIGISDNSNDSHTSPRKPKEEKAQKRYSKRRHSSTRRSVIENPGVSQVQGFFMQF